MCELSETTRDPKPLGETHKAIEEAVARFRDPGAKCRSEIADDFSKAVRAPFRCYVALFEGCMASVADSSAYTADEQPLARPSHEMLKECLTTVEGVRATGLRDSIDAACLACVETAQVTFPALMEQSALGSMVFVISNARKVVPIGCPWKVDRN